MNKYHRNISFVMLFEIIINLFMFSILLVVGLSFIAKAHTLSQSAKLLHQAVTQCNNVATLCESSNGSMDMITNEYPYCINTGKQLLIYFDSDVSACSKDEASYYISMDFSVEYADSTNPGIVHTTALYFYDMNSCEKVYSIDVPLYQKLTPLSREVAYE